MQPDHAMGADLPQSLRRSRVGEEIEACLRESGGFVVGEKLGEVEERLEGREAEGVWKV